MAKLLEQQKRPEEPERQAMRVAKNGHAAPWPGALAWQGLGHSALVLGMLVAALCVVIVVAAAVGAVAIPPLHSALILLNATHLVHVSPSWPDTEQVILLQVRLPRVVG